MFLVTTLCYTDTNQNFMKQAVPALRAVTAWTGVSQHTCPL